MQSFPKYAIIGVQAKHMFAPPSDHGGAGMRNAQNPFLIFLLVDRVTGNVDELSPALHFDIILAVARAESHGHILGCKACLRAGLLFLEAEVEVKDIEIGRIRPYENNPRYNDGAVDAVAESIRQFGWKQPIVVDKDGVIIAGHTRYKAAQKLGYKTVPCVMADDLTEEQVRAYRLADNKTAELAEWDFFKLDQELENIVSIDMVALGFDDLSEELGGRERPEAAFSEEISVMVDCESEKEAEELFSRLRKEGYSCRIST